jgi:transposase InsO family protein
MSYFICSYVRGCATCQANKIDNRPPRAATVPNTVPKRPFQVMMTNFITDLPECEGFTAIAVYVDQGYKIVYITPTVKTVNSVGASNLFMRTVFPHTSVMEQLISNQGLQFASKTVQHIYKTLGIKSSMSTAYHLQTDGQMERFNQELEQYLQIFCNYCQDDWV